MLKLSRVSLICLATQFAIVNAALAQPQMVHVGFGIQDLTADGQTAVGLFYDRPIEEYAVAKYTRGIGVVEIPGAVPGGNLTLRCSDDAGALSLHMDNIEDWGDLNCFNSNYEPPNPPPCTYVPAIAHHWTENTGWVNCGSFPYNEIVQTYTCGSDDPAQYTVRVGGTRCDFSINTPNDVSGDGRYVIGSGWYAQPDPRTDGCAPYGFCGDYVSFRWDSLTGIIETLPGQPGTHTTRADRTNYDGSVVVGYDLSVEEDPDGPGPIEVEPPTNPIRKLAVWRNGVETILDGHLHLGSPPVNSDGTMVAAQTSPITTEMLFGAPPATTEDQLYYTRLVRWTWDGNDWVAQALPKPAFYQGYPAIKILVTDISDDGNTIIGGFGYGTPSQAFFTYHPFIWKPTINGGVPIDLQDYLRSQMPMGDTTFDEDKIWLSDVRDLSADGNSMVVSYQQFPGENLCLPTFHNAILYLNGTTCEPPTVSLDSYAIVSVQPADVNAELGWSAINCRVSGTWPLEYQWQKRDLATGNWVDLVDDYDPDCVFGTNIHGEFHYQGTTTAQLRYGYDPFALFPCDGASGDYRCVVTNSCGTVASDVCHVTISPNPLGGICFLLGDMNDDIAVNAYDIPNFVASILGKPFPDSFPVDRADMNLDGRKDGRDIQEFIQAMLP